MKKLDLNKIESKLEEGRAIDVVALLKILEDNQLQAVIEELDIEEIALIFQEANSRLQKRILKLLDNREIALMLKQMAMDDVVDALKRMNISLRNELFKEFDLDYLDKIKQLIRYEDYQAGAIMTIEFLALDAYTSIAKTLEIIAKKGKHYETIDVICVLKNNVFYSVVDIKDLLTQKSAKNLLDLANKYPITVHPDTEKEKVAFLVSKYDLKAIPVVESGQILGIITVDDVIDVIVEDNSQNLLKISGASDEERVDSPILYSIKLRLPWLLVNLVTAFLASLTVGMFSDVIAKVVALAAINPIIAGMGGNAGA